jgi:hypothetical protein
VKGGGLQKGLKYLQSIIQVLDGKGNGCGIFRNDVNVLHCDSSKEPIGEGENGENYLWSDTLKACVSGWEGSCCKYGER